MLTYRGKILSITSFTDIRYQVTDLVNEGIKEDIERKKERKHHIKALLIKGLIYLCEKATLTVTELRQHLDKVALRIHWNMRAQRSGANIHHHQ